MMAVTASHLRSRPDSLTLGRRPGEGSAKVRQRKTFSAGLRFTLLLAPFCASATCHALACPSGLGRGRRSLPGFAFASIALPSVALEALPVHGARRRSPALSWIFCPYFSLLLTELAARSRSDVRARSLSEEARPEGTITVRSEGATWHVAVAILAFVKLGGSELPRQTLHDTRSRDL